MVKRILFTLLLALFVSTLIPRPLFSDDSPKPYVDFYYNDHQLKGLIGFSSTSEPKITVSAHFISGQASVEVFQSNVDSVLRYLTHDKEYRQLSTLVDTSKFTKIANLNVNIVERASQDISLPLPSSGIFFVRLILGEVSSQTFIVRSTFATLAREAKDTTVFWSQDFASGRSLSSGKVTLYNLDARPQIISSSSFGADSIASLPSSPLADVAIVEGQDSLAVIPINSRYLNTGYHWNIFQQNLPTQRFFIFTDRPIYRPGDTVKFKAIIRQDDDARYSLPQGSVNIKVIRGWESSDYIYDKTISINQSGSVSSSFVIPSDAKSGDYRLILTSDSSSQPQYYDETGDSIYFKVEHYRKPEYTIEANSSQVDVIRGQDLSISLSGQYYSGQPLINTNIKYTVKVTDAGYGPYTFTPSSGLSHYSAWWGREVDSGTLTLDNKGRGSVNISTNKTDSLGKHQIFFVEFTYQDDSGNPASTGLSFFVKPGELSLYCRDQCPWGGRPDEPIKYQFLVHQENNSATLPSKIDLDLVRIWWEEIKNPNKKYPDYNRREEVVAKSQLYPDSRGQATYEYIPSQPGSYEVRTEIVDSRGNKILKVFYFWVNDNYQPYKSSPTTSSIRLVADKQDYLPGDVAKINIISTVANRDVYLSLDRGYQDRYRIVHLDGMRGVVDIPIYAHDIPNIYLSVKSFTSNGLDSDSQNLAIDTTTKKMSLTVHTDQVNYGPGDEVTVNILAVDQSGIPIETDLALWAVDKSIFALADKNYGDIYDRFWSQRNYNTSEAHSLEGIIIDGAEKGGCFLPGTSVTMADSTVQNIESISVGDKILTRLSPSSPQTVATVVTATHQTTAPGYLIVNSSLKLTPNHLLYINSQWHSASSIKIGDILTGQDGSNVTVTSIEYLNASTPVYNLTTAKYHTYFANGIYVHNDKGGSSPRQNFSDTAYWNSSIYTNSSGQASVKFRLPDNLTSWVIIAIGASPKTQVGQYSTDIKVSKDLVIRPSLPSVIGIGDTLRVTATAHNFTNLASQATAQLILGDGASIISPELVDVTLSPNDFATISWDIVSHSDGQLQLQFVLKDSLGRQDTVIQKMATRPVSYWQQSSSFNVGSTTYSLSPPSDGFDPITSQISLTISNSLLGSLSSAVNYLNNYPYGCTEQTTSSLWSKLITRNHPNLFSQDGQAADFDNGLSRLKLLQHDDGGWAWWSDNSSDPLITSYVYRLLQEAKSSGFAVNANLLSRAQDYLLRDFDTDTFSNQVIRAYGLSFSPEPQYRRSVTSGLDQLIDNDLLAMAAIANLNSGHLDNLSNGIDLLVSRANLDQSTASWSAGKFSKFGSIEASTSLAIQALIRSDSNREIVNKAINFLTNSRRFDYWANTYSTVQSMIAILDHNDQLNVLGQNTDYSVTLNNKVIKSGILNVKSAPVIKLSIPPSSIAPNSRLHVYSPTNGQIYSTLTQKWQVQQAPSTPVTKGVTLSKKLVNHSGSNYNLSPGDLVDIIIDVKFDQNDGQYHNQHAVIEDHLPSGLIPVNTNLKNESTSSNYRNQSIEYLSDGVIIPIYNSQNTTYIYQARVVSSGLFHTPPSYYGLMYYPEIWAQTNSFITQIDAQPQISLLPSQAGSNNSWMQSFKIKFYLTLGVTIFLSILAVHFLKRPRL